MLIMDAFTISGFDVSHHQGSIDFKLALDSGERFAYVKCTGGENYLDPRFIENWNKLLDLDGQIYRGPYHFAHPESIGGASDGRAEADDFCDAIQAVGGWRRGSLPPALDFEKYSEDDIEQNVPWIEAFIKTVQDRLDRSPIIYTGRNIWRYEVGNTAIFAELGVKLWVSYYYQPGAVENTPGLLESLKDGTAYPTLAMDQLPWDTFDIWQWSGGNDFEYADRVPGINAQLDRNWFNGTESDLATLAMIGDDQECPADASKIIKLIASAEDDIEHGLVKLKSLRWTLEAASEAAAV